MTDLLTITQETIQSQIFAIRGKQVILDRDLAILYGVETKQLKRQVKRNIDRFPVEFMFELFPEEYDISRSQNGTLKQGGNVKYAPMAFTELGVVMLASVLKSSKAVDVSIQITRAFVEMRKFLRDNGEVFLRLDNLEHKQLMLKDETNQKFDKIFDALEANDLKPKQGIFYDGQVFDAYVFVSDLIRSAKQSIVLIDNYIDETVLNLFTKRAKGVSLTIYTKDISKQLSLDLKKHNQQYDPISIRQFKAAHDRFLIIDGKVVYHFGASLKDLGLKWFAFSKMEMNAADILSKLI